MEKVELGKFNEFECQVSPDQDNHHPQLRAKAILNVIGKWNSGTVEQWNTALDCTCVARHSQDYKKKRIIFNGLN